MQDRIECVYLTALRRVDALNRVTEGWNLLTHRVADHVEP